MREADEIVNLIWKGNKDFLYVPLPVPLLSNCMKKGQVTFRNGVPSPIAWKYAEYLMNIGDSFTLDEEEKSEIVEPIETVKKPIEKKYECDKCGKTFTKAVALTGHMRSHKKEEQLANAG